MLSPTLTKVNLFVPQPRHQLTKIDRNRLQHGCLIQPLTEIVLDQNYIGLQTPTFYSSNLTIFPKCHEQKKLVRPNHVLVDKRKQEYIDTKHYCQHLLNISAFPTLFCFSFNFNLNLILAPSLKPGRTSKCDSCALPNVRHACTYHLNQSENHRTRPCPCVNAATDIIVVVFTCPQRHTY